ncbi:unnamed protein product, partial [Didymodactylos carnosus]
MHHSRLPMLSHLAKIHLSTAGTSVPRRTHKGTHGHVLYPSQRRQSQKPARQITAELKRKLDDSLIKAIIVDGRSFNDFSKPGIIDFLDLAIPDYRPPHRTTIRCRIQKLYAEERENLRQQLSTVQNIALTIDVWKSSSHIYYLCLSGHYFDNNYELKHNVLAFRRFIGSHTGQRLQRFLENEVEKINIQHKISATTCDNGADIRCAITASNVLGPRFSCLAHDLNLTVKNGLWLYKQPKGSEKSSTTAAATTMLKENELVEDDDDNISIADGEDVPDEIIETYLPQSEEDE